jgi:hypothetical protein
METSRELVLPIVMRTFSETLRHGSGVLSHLGQAASCVTRANYALNKDHEYSIPGCMLRPVFLPSVKVLNHLVASP